ncbi:hypothetical protein ACLB2K_007435 [Fragaria x ananassa]
MKEYTLPRPMKEYTLPTISNHPSCIVLPPCAVAFDIKLGTIANLLLFFGLSNNEPYLHLQEFNEACSTVQLLGIDEGNLRLRLFSFSLKDKAKKWLYNLHPRSINTWEEMQKVFLQFYFPPHKSNSMRNDLLNFRDLPSDFFYETCERFKDLECGVPIHGLSRVAVLSSFYTGLTQEFRRRVDNACEGCFMNKTEEEATRILDELSVSSQLYDCVSNRKPFMVKSAQVPMKKLKPRRGMYNVDALNIQMLQELKRIEGEMQKKLDMILQTQCNLLGYPMKSINDSYGNPYNPGWRNNPNIEWGGNQNREEGQDFQRPYGGYQGASSSNYNNQGGNNVYHAPRPPDQAPPQHPLPLHQPQVSNQEARKTPTLEEMMAAFVRNQAKQDEKINILTQGMSKLEVQMRQLANELSQRKQGVFPSQVENNPRHEVKAITILRSGRQVENNVYMPTNDELASPREPPGFERSAKHKQVVLDDNEGQEEVLKNNFNSKTNNGEDVSNDHHSMERPFKRCITFNPPLEIVQEKRRAVKTIPSYAKFLKDMCTKKKKFKEHEQVALCEEVSAIIQRKLPPKLKDPGSFTIPSKIGETTFEKCLMDLGASINLMPYSALEKLGLERALKETSITLQLADRSVRYPSGILENVLVNVAKFVIPVDFTVLDMEDAPIVDNELPIIFERGFMATGVKINVKKGTMSMQVLGDKIKFQIFPPLNVSDNVNERYLVGRYGEAQVRGDEKSNKEAWATLPVSPCSQDLVSQSLSFKGHKSLVTPIKKKNQVGGMLKGLLVGMGVCFGSSKVCKGDGCLKKPP